MSHCAAIRFLIDARRYIHTYYGGTEAALILSQALVRVCPEEFVCGTCGGRHSKRD